jgi:hypothetical protein
MPPMIHVATTEGLHTLDGTEAVRLEGRSIDALVGSGGDLWAILDEAEVGRIGDDWQLEASLPERCGCLLPLTEGLLAGGADARLYRVIDGEARRVTTFDEVEGRGDWYTPWGGPPDVRSLARDADGAANANVHVGGILRSPDGGESWSPTEIAIDSDVHQVIAHPEIGGWLLAATGWGLATSADGGENWEFTDEGLHSSYCRAVAVSGEFVLMTASTGPHGGRAAVYRRPPGTQGSLEKCELGLPEWFQGNIDTHWLVAHGAVVAFGTEDGEVFLSEDSGGSFEQVAKDLPRIRALVLA